MLFSMDNAGKSALNNLQFNLRETERLEMAEEKILTKHPLGKSGKNIGRQKYDTLKKAHPIGPEKQAAHSHGVIREAQ